MSVGGISSIGFAQTAMAYRSAFLTISTVMLVGALWAAFRRDGGVFNKVLTACATLAGFVLSLRLLEVF